MGIKISTDEFGVKVWRSDKHGFPQYAIRLGRQIDGEWVNEYQQIRFRTGVELENGAEIFIDDAFATMDAWKKNGEAHGRQVWQILEFRYKTSGQQRPAPKKQAPIQETFDDLPDTFQAAEDEIPF